MKEEEGRGVRKKRNKKKEIKKKENEEKIKRT